MAPMRCGSASMTRWRGRGESLPPVLIPLLQRVSAFSHATDDQSDSAPDAPHHDDARHAHAHATVSAGVPETSLGAERSGRAESAAALVERTVAVRLTADCPLKGVRAMLVMARLESMGSISAVVPAQTTWQDDRFDGAFTVHVHTASEAEAIEQAVRGAGDVARVVVAAPAPRSARDASSEALRTVRVDRRRLDTLLELVGELVINRDRLLPLAEEADTSAGRLLSRAAHDTARLISALQDEVLQARMVPVGHVFDRFPRLVRDIARDLGKDVQFVTEGREIELDRSLLDAIADPLVHLLRNALDHGIEDPSVRRTAGKSPSGQLVLRAVRDRSTVILQVEDDGRGIDRAAILRRAKRQGLVAESVMELDDDALLHVLAAAGFSTARAVTAISGRGVGVDVVTTRVRALGGTLELETIEGQGTVFTLRLPVTLAITRALLVRVSDATYALPAAHVVEVLEYTPGMIVTAAARESITLRDEVIPLLHLRERFGLPRRPDDSYVAVVESGGRRTALAVDALLAQQDIVVKPFDAMRGSAPWFSGATVLGDGTPALIVDLGSLT
jgi:two-component system chemotaxis sensor kinase CheA